MIAHRGARAYAPENTLAAFALSMRQHADGVELDVRLTKDGQVVVFHDDWLDDKTDGNGPVEDHAFLELRALDAGTHFDSAFKSEQIPTLSEVFETVGRDCLINVELKPLTNGQEILAKQVALTVKHHRVSDQILFSSFNPQAMQAVKRHLPAVPIGHLASAGQWAQLNSRIVESWLKPDAYHPDHHDVSSRLLKYHHRRDRWVFAYTANDADDLYRLYSLGMDGVISDDPVLARTMLTSAQNA